MADDRRRQHDARHARLRAKRAAGALSALGLLFALGPLCALSVWGALCAAVLSSPPAYAGPPPWTTSGRPAPADRQQLAYRFPAALKDGRCRPNMFDTAAVHGLVGHRRDLRSGLGRRDGGRRTKLGDTAIGILLSAVSDGHPSPGIPRADEICFSQSFEHVPDRTTVAWSSPTLTVRFSVIPMRTLRTSDGRYCREYAAKATVNGHAADVYGTACRRPDGDWYLVD